MIQCELDAWLDEYKLRQREAQKMSDMSIVSDQEILGGMPVFAWHTMFQIQTMIEYLERGLPLEEFLDDFPTVSLEQAQAVLSAESEGREPGNHRFACARQYTRQFTPTGAGDPCGHAEALRQATLSVLRVSRATTDGDGQRIPRRGRPCAGRDREGEGTTLDADGLCPELKGICQGLSWSALCSRCQPK